MVRLGVDGTVGTGWRTGWAQETKCGSDLRSIAVVDDEPAAKTLGVAGKQDGWCDAGDVQARDDVHGHFENTSKFVKDVGESTCFENRETELLTMHCGDSRLVGEAGEVCNVEIGQMWEAKGLGIWFGRKEDLERRLASMV